MTDTNISEKKYMCECCNYKTSRNSQYLRHLDTNKHKIQQQQINIDQNNSESTDFICLCGKSYKERSGLWRHKKICDEINYKTTNENSDKILIMKLINDNKELRNQLLKKNKEHEIMMIKILENVISK